MTKIIYGCMMLAGTGTLYILATAWMFQFVTQGVAFAFTTTAMVMSTLGTRLFYNKRRVHE